MFWLFFSSSLQRNTDTYTQRDTHLVIVMSLQEPFFLDRAVIMKMRIMMTIMLLLMMVLLIMVLLIMVLLMMVLLMILKIMMFLQEPFFLDRAVICSEQEGEMAAAARDHLDYFEIQEFGSKDSFVFKVV